GASNVVSRDSMSVIASECGCSARIPSRGSSILRGCDLVSFQFPVPSRQFPALTDPGSRIPIFQPRAASREPRVALLLHHIPNMSGVMATVPRIHPQRLVNRHRAPLRVQERLAKLALR